MQAAGDLKKRRKRNLAKVTGLSTNPYDQENDTFNVSSIFGQRKQSSTNGRPSRASLIHNSLFLEDDDELDGDFTIEMNNVPTGSKDRPYLFSRNIMWKMKWCLFVSTITLALPWKWNPETGQIDNWSKPYHIMWEVIWYPLAVQTAFMTFYRIWAFYDNFAPDADGSYRPVVMNSFSCTHYIQATLFNICIYLYREDLRRYINMMFDLNKKFVEKYVIDLTDYPDTGKVLLNVSIVTNSAQIFFMTSLFVVFHNNSVYLYHYIDSPDNPWWYLIIPLIHEFFAIGQMLCVGWLIWGWILAAHVNTVQFWLEETHRGNETGRTVKSIRVTEKAIEIYRSLQTLNAVFNEAMGSLIIPVIKEVNWLALIPSAYVLVRSVNHKFIDEFPGIGTYPVSVIDTIACAFGFLTTAAEVSDISGSFLTSWSLTSNRDLRRMLVSMPQLKVKVSWLYKITVSTNITYFKSVTDKLIDLIVTVK